MVCRSVDIGGRWVSVDVGRSRDGCKWAWLGSRGCWGEMIMVVDSICGVELRWFLYQSYEKCCMPESCVVGAAWVIFLLLEVKGSW